MQDVEQVSVCDSEKETQSSQNCDCSSIVASDTSSQSTNKCQQSYAQLDDKCTSSADSESEDEDISEVILPNMTINAAISPIAIACATCYRIPTLFFSPSYLSTSFCFTLFSILFYHLVVI